MKNNILKLRIFLWTIVSFMIALFLYWGVIPSGQISYVYDFEKKGRFIKNLTPKERLEDVVGGSQKIIGDPVYFSLWTPRTFNKAKLTFKYKNPSNKFIETGVLVDGKMWRYDLKPIENNVLENIFLTWNNLKQNGLVLSQRSEMEDDPFDSAQGRKYKSIDNFLKNLPEIKKIAVYNYNLDYEYLIKDYSKSKERLMINSSLRGAHQFYTYIKDEDLDFEFSFFDLNKNKDADRIDVHLYYDDVLLEVWNLDDDKVAGDTGEISEIKKLKLKTENLPEGVYKLEIRANDDIVIDKIETKQSKIAFLNKLWLYNDGEEDLSIVSNAPKLRVKTINPGSLQSVRAGAEVLDIDETYKQFEIKGLNMTHYSVDLEKDGLIIEGNGIFSLNDELFFNPVVKKIDKDFDIKVEDVDYVLAKYLSPKSEDENGWTVASVEFDIKNAYREGNKYNFLISVPGLEDGEFVEVGEIKVELDGRSLVEKLKGFLK